MKSRNLSGRLRRLDVKKVFTVAKDCMSGKQLIKYTSLILNVLVVRMKL